MPRNIAGGKRHCEHSGGVSLGGSSCCHTNVHYVSEEQDCERAFLLLEAGDDPVMEPGRGRGLELLGWARPPEAEWRLAGWAQNGAGLDISPLRPRGEFPLGQACLTSAKFTLKYYRDGAVCESGL